MVERFGNVLSECVPRTARRDSPSTAIIGITPQQITHRSFVWNFLDTIQGSNVVKGIDGRAQPTMQTEDLVFDESGEGEVIEKVGKVFPDIGVAIFAKTLVIEAVDLGDLTGLVVSTKDGNALRVTNLQADQESHGLDGVVTTINIVT